MAEFYFTGRVTLEGVTFWIEAKDEDEAKRLARDGRYSDYDTSFGSAADWTINENTCVRNDEDGGEEK